MTKRRTVSEEPYSRLELAQYRLRWIASALEKGEPLSDGVRDGLISALRRIAKGEDANVVLDLKEKRGERKTSDEAMKREKLSFIISYITAQTTREVTQYFTRPAMPLGDAIASAAEFFGLNEETVRTLWHTYPERRSASFDRPISSLPD
jgi:hypothetical protein